MAFDDQARARIRGVDIHDLRICTYRYRLHELQSRSCWSPNWQTDEKIELELVCPIVDPHFRHIDCRKLAPIFAPVWIRSLKTGSRRSKPSSMNKKLQLKEEMLLVLKTEKACEQGYPLPLDVRSFSEPEFRAFYDKSKRKKYSFE